MLALGVLPPALLTGVVLLASWWRLRLPDDQAQRHALNPPTVDTTRAERLWLAPLVMGVAYLGVHAALLGGIRPPRSAADWMPLIALAAVVLGLTARSIRLHIAARWTLRAAVVAAAGVAVAWNKLRNGPDTETLLTLAGYTAHTLAAWWALERLAHSSRGPAPVIVAMLYATAASQVIALAYFSLRIAQMPTAMAACLGAAAVVAFIRPRFTLAFGGVHAPVLISQAALLQALLFTSERENLFVHPPVLLLTAVLPVLAGLLPLPPRRKAIATIAAALVGTGLTIGLAAALRPPPSEYAQGIPAPELPARAPAKPAAQHPAL